MLRASAFEVIRRQAKIHHRDGTIPGTSAAMGMNLEGFLEEES